LININHQFKLLGLWLTPQGKKLLGSLQPWPGLVILEPQADRQESLSLSQQIAQAWPKYDGLIFCMAAGAVVRLIAPYLNHKATDPAVVVIDDRGKFAISLCGGHLGGGDRLAMEISVRLDAQAVITSASTGLNLPGIDLIGAPYGWRRGEGDWTKVSAAAAKQLPIQVWQESGSKLWQSHLPDGHPFAFAPAPQGSIDQARIWISVRDWRSVSATPMPMASQFGSNQSEGSTTINLATSILSNQPALALPNVSTIPTVQWHPRLLWLGIGCERGVSAELIGLAVDRTLQQYGLAAKAIAGIASIDLKADEAGLLAFAHQAQLPLTFFNAEQLKAMTVPNPSAVVAQEVGTPSVAEAAALIAAQEASQVTIDQAQPANPHRLLVSKQIMRDPAYAGAVTVAIALANLESIGKSGQLALVGIGPGSLSQITPAAKQAIVKADAIIGYGLYIDLIKPLLRPGQVVETYAITKERQRADRAVDLAQWGLSVAVISSGDCGIYGMAGLVLEALQARDWDGRTPAVEVFPGITALQAAAARVGTPLMHDFCAISLSDLLTPIEVITKRLVAAAQADFVIALYNPRSQTRTKPMDQALEIFRQHRDHANPIALVKSAFRPNEQVKLTTLGELQVEDVDMFTTVLVGNSRTRFYQDHLITPRSYY
jgi:cobalt-precorrin 5A hydrolase/precorrin-3B C17-methyltransferase